MKSIKPLQTMIFASLALFTACNAPQAVKQTAKQAGTTATPTAKESLGSKPSTSSIGESAVIPTPDATANAVTTASIVTTPTFTNWLPTGIYGTGESWLFHIRDSGIPPWTGTTFSNSLTKYKLGEGAPQGRDGKVVLDFSEFDYTYYGIQPGQQIGDGSIRDNRDCYGPQPGCYQSGPTTPSEAYGRLQSYWNNHIPRSAAKSWLKASNGHYYFQHYAAEWGADLILSEVGEGINSVNAHIAFTRGAAKQFQRSWGMDVSNWYGPTIRDYSEKKVWGAASGPNNGHSISLTKRIYYASYMAGAQYLLEEAGGIYFFNGEKTGADGLFVLSPMGVMAQEFAAFTREHPDRGKPIVPAAILLQAQHGIGLGWWSSGKPWDYLNMTAANQWTNALLNALWPNSFQVAPPANFPESNYQVRGVLGDGVDVILETADIPLLKSYQMIFLSGDLSISQNLFDRLYQFVANGGTLVIDYPQTAVFLALSGATSTQNPIGSIPLAEAGRYSYGNGSIIQVKNAGYYGDVIANLYWEKMPVYVQGDVEVLLNRLEHSWVVTLINNNGVTKSPTTAEVNNGASVAVTVAVANGVPPSSVITWRSAHPVEYATATNQAKVAVDSGDVVVIEMKDR